MSEREIKQVCGEAKEILHWVVGCQKEELNYQNVMSWLEALRGKRKTNEKGGNVFVEKAGEM